jgi:hypothetical protein
VDQKSRLFLAFTTFTGSLINLAEPRFAGFRRVPVSVFDNQIVMDRKTFESPNFRIR